MPNWCENEVTVYGNEQDLRKLLALASQSIPEDDDEELVRVEGQRFRMEAVHPTPDELLTEPTEFDDSAQLAQALERNKTHGYTNWYNWRVAHWGTKWDMSDLDMESITPEEGDEEAHFNIRYNTAWSPNTAFWKYVCSKGPFRVQLRYIEQGVGFIGEDIISRDKTDEYSVDITTEMIESVGGVLGDDGEIDWDVSDVTMWDLFPLKREKVK